MVKSTLFIILTQKVSMNSLSQRNYPITNSRPTTAAALRNGPFVEVIAIRETVAPFVWLNCELFNTQAAMDFEH